MEMLLRAQNEVYQVLNYSLRRLQPSQYQEFIERSLSIYFKVDFSRIPLPQSADLLFTIIDRTGSCRGLLDIKNILAFSAWLLEG